MKVWIVLMHHDVDGGYQGARVHATRDGAINWLLQNGYRVDGPNHDTWMKPVYAKWDSNEYLACPSSFEMEIAEVYETEVEP